MSPEQAAAVVQGGTSSSGGTSATEECPVPVAGATVADSGMARDDFTAVAKLVYVQFCELMDRLEKLDAGLNIAAEQHTTTVMRQESQISNQLQLLRQTMSQNSELRDRLAQIQALCSGESKVVISTPVGGQSVRTSSMSYRTGGGSISRFDSFVSLHSTMSDKFFDAVEQVHDSSSEDEIEVSEEEESGEESEIDVFSSLPHEVLTKLSRSPSAGGHATNGAIPEEDEDETPEGSSHETSPDPQIPVTVWVEGPKTGGHGTLTQGGGVSQGIVRRTTLPAPISELADFSLWSLLRKNIGKDLSKISMPVSMNEPLSALQRQCEELEYSDLLDRASALKDPFDRMVRVACFAVSSYATSFYRAGKKPFNPILGETYECVREDRGFKFIAEQVSHHPPVAACHCSSPNFEFWQDARIKSKFWGKSMEVFPIGVVNVTLPKHGDHYKWQKVTSCIHNVFAGQRWVDQYGEMTITNNDVCSCKLTFVKASYWSSKKYIVHGDVYDNEGVAVRHLFGTWNEAMYCGKDGEDTECIWKAADMPPNHDRYYGFSYYAIQLNELQESLRHQLPCTDCRFRPDQRMLENGEVQDAELEKKRVEQIQREARAERERLGVDWSPNFFEKLMEGDEEKWISKGTYWDHRDKNFTDIQLPTLW